MYIYARYFSNQKLTLLYILLKARDYSKMHVFVRLIIGCLINETVFSALVILDKPLDFEDL